jgi:hypothetical protein
MPQRPVSHPAPCRVLGLLLALLALVLAPVALAGAPLPPVIAFICLRRRPAHQRRGSHARLHAAAPGGDDAQVDTLGDHRTGDADAFLALVMGAGCRPWRRWRCWTPAPQYTPWCQRARPPPAWRQA